MSWREPQNHSSVCYFFASLKKGISTRQRKKFVSYVSVSSVTLTEGNGSRKPKFTPIGMVTNHRHAFHFVFLFIFVTFKEIEDNNNEDETASDIDDRNTNSNSGTSFYCRIYISLINTF